MTPKRHHARPAFTFRGLAALSVLALGAMLGGTAAAQGFPTRYSITTELPGPAARPDAVAFRFNNNGQATGYGFFREGTVTRLVFINGWPRFVTTQVERGVAVRWDGSVGTALKPLVTNASATVSDINDSGWVAGQSFKSTTGKSGYAVVWRDGRTIDLGGGEASEAQHINALGWVVGYRTTSGTYQRRPFLWRNGRLEDLSTFLPNTYAVSAHDCVGVSDTGVIACRALDASAATAPSFSAVWRSFVWNAGVFQELHYPGAESLVVSAVSPGGVVAGFLRLAGDTTLHDDPERPFLWRNGTFSVLPQITASMNRQIIAVDDQGTMLTDGFVNNLDRQQLWTAGGQVIDVQATVSVTSGERVTRLMAVNARGQLLASVRKPWGTVDRQVVLSPATP